MMMLHCNMKLMWQTSYAPSFRSKVFHPFGVVNLNGGGGCSVRTKLREAGTAKCASSAARSGN
jgi:hypothetical protein